MIHLGDYNTLTIDHVADQGLYLTGDEKTGDILLPQRYVTPQMQVGDAVEVFVYLDQQERIIATTEQPLARVGQFAFLQVAWTNQYGAFLHWGLLKDLFCPFREQKQRMQRGKGYIVYVKEDEATHRLMATAKVEKYLEPASAYNNERTIEAPSGAVGGAERAEGAGAKHGQPCDCLVWQKTDLGFKAIVDNRYQGQLYDNQIFQPLRTGDRLTAYIDHVREDGKIDLTLQPTGHRQTLDFAQVLLRYLHENDGRCNLGDHSPAEIIADRFQVSKKTFKRAIGDLYRRRLIVITDEGIRLSDNTM
ncbi:MAG: GntR family transcriptional regulator [Prevotella sp.]|nr:GntR family transcriptional regulator [Prevotella sp.]